MPYVLLETLFLFFFFSKTQDLVSEVNVFGFSSLKHESNIFEIFLNLLALCDQFCELILNIIVDLKFKIQIDK